MTNTDNKNTGKQPPPKPALNFLLMGAGSMFTSMIVAGFLVGYALDEVFDTKPIFLLSCGLLGFIGGMQKIQRLLSKMDQLDPPKAKDASEKSE